MMKHGFITASVNIDELDPAFADFAYCHTENRDAFLNKVLTNSFGFGGTNACHDFREGIMIKISLIKELENG